MTALLLVPTVIAAELWLSTPGFALFLGAVVLVGAWEWCALAGAPGRVQRALYLVLTALAMLLCWRTPQWQLWLLGGGRFPLSLFAWTGYCYQHTL